MGNRYRRGAWAGNRAGGYEWLQEHDARLKAESTQSAQDQVIAPRQKSIEQAKADQAQTPAISSRNSPHIRTARCCGDPTAGRRSRQYPAQSSRAGPGPANSGYATAPATQQIVIRRRTFPHSRRTSSIATSPAPSLALHTQCSQRRGDASRTQPANSPR